LKSSHAHIMIYCLYVSHKTISLESNEMVAREFYYNLV
jgi:hypothetical protein